VIGHRIGHRNDGRRAGRWRELLAIFLTIDYGVLQLLFNSYLLVYLEKEVNENPGLQKGCHEALVTKLTNMKKGQGLRDAVVPAIRA
jgi:hypothetical protein